MTAALDGGEWSGARPSSTLPLGKSWYSFYRKRGGPQGRSERAKNLVPTGIPSQNRPARSQSLYRQSYRVHIKTKSITVAGIYERLSALSNSNF